MYFYNIEFNHLFYSYVNASLWKYMEKHKVKQDSKAFQLVRIYFHLNCLKPQDIFDH